jgi:hypothetical protein
LPLHADSGSPHSPCVEAGADVGHVRLQLLGHQLRAECEIVIRTSASAVDGREGAVAAEHELLDALPRLSAALVHPEPHADKDVDYCAELASRCSRGPNQGSRTFDAADLA